VSASISGQLSVIESRRRYPSITRQRACRPRPSLVDGHPDAFEDLQVAVHRPHRVPELGRYLGHDDLLPVLQHLHQLQLAREPITAGHWISPAMVLHGGSDIRARGGVLREIALAVPVLAALAFREWGGGVALEEMVAKSAVRHAPRTKDALDAESLEGIFGIELDRRTRRRSR
jgi:hypothetical protein